LLTGTVLTVQQKFFENVSELKMSTHRRFLFNFRQHTASTFAKPYKAYPLTKALQKSLLSLPTLSMLITLIRFFYEIKK